MAIIKGNSVLSRKDNGYTVEQLYDFIKKTLNIEKIGPTIQNQVYRYHYEWKMSYEEIARCIKYKDEHTSGDSPDKRWNPVYGLALTEDIREAARINYEKEKQSELDRQKIVAKRKASVTENQDINDKFNKITIKNVPDKDITFRSHGSYDDIFFDEDN